MVGTLLANWELWASLGAGLGVSGLVYMFGGFVQRRRSVAQAFEEDLPWENLLDLLKTREAAGKPNELSSDELMKALLAEMPTSDSGPPDMTWEPRGSERRRSRRRWANPIEVVLVSAYYDKPLHGLVINRSTGGLAILTDVPFDANTVLGVRPVDAPSGVGYIDVCVRHAREVSSLWFIGCEYKQDIPWNVKVWFG